MKGSSCPRGLERILTCPAHDLPSWVLSWLLAGPRAPRAPARSHPTPALPFVPGGVQALPPTDVGAETGRPLAQGRTREVRVTAFRSSPRSPCRAFGMRPRWPPWSRQHRLGRGTFLWAQESRKVSLAEMSTGHLRTRLLGSPTSTGT